MEEASPDERVICGMEREVSASRSGVDSAMTRCAQTNVCEVILGSLLNRSQLNWGDAGEEGGHVERS